MTLFSWMMNQFVNAGQIISKYKPNYSTQEITTAQCKLLEAMAKTLGYEKKITWETIQNPYLPDGLVQRMEKTAKFEQGQLAMAEFMTNMAGNPAPLGKCYAKTGRKTGEYPCQHLNGLEKAR